MAALDPLERSVFLIAEAEVNCEMNGIDTFLRRFAPTWVDETAAAFEAIGAGEIASELRPFRRQFQSVIRV